MIGWREREDDIKKLVDKASRRLTTEHKVLPTGTDSLEQVPDGLEPKGYHRRYVGRALGESMPFFSLGVRDPFAGHLTPVWMRFNKSTPEFPLIQARLKASELNPKLVESGGHIWIPLEVPFGVSAEAMTEGLVGEAEAVIRVVYQLST